MIHSTRRTLLIFARTQTYARRYKSVVESKQATARRCRFCNLCSWPRHSLSDRTFIECRDIGLFRISNSISYRTSHIVYLDILKTNEFFVFFRRKFQKFAENSENSPKILKIRRKFWKFAENSPKILKIRQKFLKKKVFFEALISYRIVSYRKKNPHIVSISYRIKKKLIATQWYELWKAFRLVCIIPLKSSGALFQMSPR